MSLRGNNAPHRGSRVLEWRHEQHELNIKTTRLKGPVAIEGHLRLRGCSPGVLRVSFCERKPLPDPPSLMVQSGAPRALTVTADDGFLLVYSGGLGLRLDLDPLRLTWLDAAGTVLAREPETGGMRVQPAPVERWHQEGSTEVAHGVDGIKAKRAAGHWATQREAFQARLHWNLSPDQALYGLGQHEDGILNYRGREQYLYQSNMKVAMPVLLSSAGWGLLLDANGLVTFRDDADGMTLWAELVEQLDYYVILGPSFDQIVAGLRSLTGSCVMLPRWSFGYIQSKERYESQQELLEVAHQHRQRKLPLDALIQDWQSWPPGQWGQKSFDAERFPDPKELTAELHDLNVRLMVSIWPSMHGGGANEAEMKEAGLMLNDDTTYNAFEPAARKLYWEQAKRGYFDHGVDGWWCDCTEPFEADWQGDFRLPAWRRLQVNVAEARAYLDPTLTNAYSLVHSQGLYEGQRSTSSERRVINLTRSAYPGQQRYGTVTWSGDVAAKWEVLRAQIADGLNFSATGVPHWTCDIGGFFVRPGEQWFWDAPFPGGTDDLGYRELYLRWFQYGCFLPMFRSHGTDIERELWCFGEAGTPHYDALVRFARLRYRLLPYLYSIAGWVSHRDYTWLRLLAFDFRSDPQVADVADQFMCGPALMVCPVCDPIYHAANSKVLEGREAARSVYLPAGSDWYDFWTGARFRGGQRLLASAPLEQVPLFVRAGSIVPLGPALEHTSDQPDAPWELRVYPGDDGAFSIYEDAGDGYEYESGAHRWTEVRYRDRERRLDIWQHGSFKGMVAERSVQAVLVAPGKGVADISGSAGAGFRLTPQAQQVLLE